MDIYQIFITHNSGWSVNDIVMMLFTVFIATIIALFLFAIGRFKLRQSIAFILLAAFLLLVFESTVFRRNAGVRRAQLELFWSYKVILKGDKEILKEVILNVILLFPAGFLLPAIADTPINPLWGLVFGGICSAAIESLQYIMKRGLFEFDDIFHNSIGCMLGCICMSLLIMLFRRCR